MKSLLNTYKKQSKLEKSSSLSSSNRKICTKNFQNKSHALELEEQSLKKMFTIKVKNHFDNNFEIVDEEDKGIQDSQRLRHNTLKRVPENRFRASTMQSNRLSKPKETGNLHTRFFN